MSTRHNKVTPSSGNASRRFSRIVFLLASLLLFCITYWKTFIWIWERSSAPDSYYSHAFLIPFVSGYLIWRQRSTLLQDKPESSGLGLVLIMLALGLHLLSVLLDVYFASGFSILILIFGLSLYLLGRPITRRLLFSIGFLVFMFPLPTAALDSIGMPMKLFATSCGARMIDLFGIPVVREGFQLHFTSASLLIGNPCSGLRSLIALLALGSLFAYLVDRPVSRRIGILVATIPIAIFCNIMRVIALSLVANSFGSEVATGLFHDLSGFLAFALALVMLFGLGRVISTGKKV